MNSNNENAVDALVHGFLAQYPEEAARSIENLPAMEIAGVLEKRPAKMVADMLRKVTSEHATQIVEHMTDQTARQVLTRMEPAFAASLLSRMQEDLRERFFSLLPDDAAKELRDFMSYPPDSAGHLMDPKVLTLPPGISVKQALSKLRKFKRRKLVKDIFLVDENGHLQGTVSVLDLAIAKPVEPLNQLKKDYSPRVQSIASREEVVEQLSRWKLSSIPVLDFEGRVIGVIRHSALVDAAQEEISADIQTMVGVSKEERALSKISFAVRKRLPWLQINLGTAFLAAAVVGLFEETIARFTALAVLLPVVAGQSGNTGAQALAVTMRGLVLREIRTKNWLRVSWKELNAGFLNGIVVALTTAFFVYLWSQSLGLAMIIGISMVLSMVIAALTGVAVPIILTTLGQDPAQSSSIILTTVTDVAGFFIFLGTATALSEFI